MEGSGAGAGKQDESPTEVEEMQAEWEIFFGQEFGEVTIDPAWVNQMRNGDGSLISPDDIKASPRELANSMASFDRMTNSWRDQQNQIATDVARTDFDEFEKLYPVSQYPDRAEEGSITYKDPNFLDRVGDAAKGIGNFAKGVGNFASNLFPNTSEKIKDTATGKDSLEVAILQDLGGGAKNLLGLGKDKDEISKPSNYDNFVTQYNKDLLDTSWVQQGRPEVYYEPQGSLDRMTNEMLQETGMRNYLNELSKTLPEAVGAISGGASDVMGGSSPSIAYSGTTGSNLSSGFGSGPGFDRLGPDPSTIGIPTAANEYDYTGYMGQAQDLIGGPRFEPFAVSRPRPQDLSTFNPDYGQVDTEALMNMLKELANQVPTTPEPPTPAPLPPTPLPPEPVIPTPVITSPGPDAGPRDSVVTTPKLITDAPADPVKFNVVEDALGNKRLGLAAPDPVSVVPPLMANPVAPPAPIPAPVVTPLPPAPAPVASPKDEIVKIPQMLTDVPTPQEIQQQVLKELAENVVGNIIPAQPGGTFIPNPPEAGIDPVIEEAIKAYVEAPKGPMLNAKYLNTATTGTPLPIGININNAFPPVMPPAMVQEIMNSVVAPTPPPVVVAPPIPVAPPVPVAPPISIAPPMLPNIPIMPTIPTIPTITSRPSVIPKVKDVVKNKRAIGGSGVFQDSGRSFGGGGSSVKVDAPIYRFRH